ncbi:MAG: alpha/beta hydrolase [Desulfobacterales bacterium]|nr:alpha/beta hydrolase [Desulfobacterales bacterium]
MNTHKKIVQRAFLLLLVFALKPISVDARKVDDCSIVINGEAQAVSFITKTKEGQNVSVDGVLMKPEGDGPFSGVVLLHGSDGIFPPSCYEPKLRHFVESGYASLLIDSTSAERPTRWMGKYTSEDQAQDAHKGRTFLAKLPYVMSDRIGVVGWSRGGAAAIEAVSNNKMTFRMEKEAPFQAAVTLFPICWKMTTDLEAPLLILIGEADSITPAVVCKRMTVSKRNDVEYQIVTYPDIEHVFDFEKSSSYDEQAALDAYVRSDKFFAKYLKE